jgi:hypothetical protein
MLQVIWYGQSKPRLRKAKRKHSLFNSFLSSHFSVAGICRKQWHAGVLEPTSSPFF